jgi:metallophosphoesterase (TIGR00282 family)
MRILYIAEIVGKAGMYCMRKGFASLKKKTRADFAIAGADGATNATGLGKEHAAFLRKLGVDVLTTGEYCFYKKDLTEDLGKIPYVLRPANLSAHAPGVGARVYFTGDRAARGNKKVAVTVLLGQSYFEKLHSENPWTRLPAILERLRAETPFIVVDFHAAATAEKRSLFEVAAGKASAVIGSHTRVQTADAMLLRGTAVISDAGRTGSIDSVGGCESDSRIGEYLTGIPNWSKPAWANLQIQGVVIDIDDTGAARAIERVQYHVDPPPATTTKGQSD